MTVAVQRGSVLPAAQLLPGALVVTVIVSTVSGTGLFTVKVPVMTTVPPTGMFPVHEAPGR